MHGNPILLRSIFNTGPHACWNLVSLLCVLVECIGICGGRSPYQIKLQRYLCQATPLFTLFSVTRTKLAVDRGGSTGSKGHR